jgi:2-keto-3-deoxy-6-phosphogluconate aldolase
MQILQLYPVSLMGGIQYVKMLKQLFPDLPIIPANGISLGERSAYVHLCCNSHVGYSATFNYQHMHLKCGKPTEYALQFCSMQ